MLEEKERDERGALGKTGEQIFVNGENISEEMLVGKHLMTELNVDAGTRMRRKATLCRIS